MLYMIALASAPFGVLEKSQFFLPITKGLMARSARLLEISILPSSRYLRRYFSWFRLYVMAAPKRLFGSTFSERSLHQLKYASTVGSASCFLRKYRSSMDRCCILFSIRNRVLQYSKPCLVSRAEVPSFSEMPFKASSYFRLA